LQALLHPKIFILSKKPSNVYLTNSKQIARFDLDYTDYLMGINIKILLSEYTMDLPLMPKATAVWLIDNTTLTFEQIAEFCGMHALEVKGIADGEVMSGIAGINPVTNAQLLAEEIKRCESDENAKLELSTEAKQHIKVQVKKKKTSKYTPIARRQDKPDAIAWFLKHCPDVSEQQISKLIGTTKNTIASIKSRAHWNISNIKPRDPVLVGLCTQIELDKVLEKAHLAQSKEKRS
jgi:uncharacterized protein